MALMLIFYSTLNRNVGIGFPRVAAFPTIWTTFLFKLSELHVATRPSASRIGILRAYLPNKVIQYFQAQPRALKTWRHQLFYYFSLYLGRDHSVKCSRFVIFSMANDRLIRLQPRITAHADG